MFERKTYQLIIITSQRFTNNFSSIVQKKEKEKEKEIKRKNLYDKNLHKIPTKPLEEFP